MCARVRHFFPIVSLLLLAPTVLRASDASADRLNKKIAPANVVGLDGKPAVVSPAGDAKATVVVFLSFNCPVSNSYASTLTDLAKSSADRGARFVAVCPTDDPAGEV